MSRFEHGNKEKIILESFGGNGGLITGSCHKVGIRDSQMIVDLGMFQGPEERTKRGERRNLDLSEIDYRGVSHALITHSHIDHCGRIPLAFKKGFRFDICATEATASLLEEMLKNSAKIQEQYRPEQRLYERKDVDTALRHLKGIEPFKEFSVGQRHSRISAEFLLNGHILGSASVLIRDKKDPYHPIDIFMSGDIGKPRQSLTGGYLDFVDMYPNDPVDVMVLESTNFEKAPIPFEKKEEELMTTFEKIWARGGNVLLPVLSLHRSQEIMEMLHNLQISGKIPEDCRIVIDAPLAMKLTGIYKDLANDNFLMRYGNDELFYKTEAESLSRFELKNCEIVESHEESLFNDQKMANYYGKVIILASGGMFGFGRSVNYRDGYFCKNPKNGIIFTCFQVDGTVGARILFGKNNKKTKNEEGARDKKGRLIGAQVFQVNGFTSHASGSEIFDFMGRFNLTRLSLVDIGHGRDSSRQKMAEELKIRGCKADIITPKIGEKIDVYA